MSTVAELLDWTKLLGAVSKLLAGIGLAFGTANKEVTTDNAEDLDYWQQGLYPPA